MNDPSWLPTKDPITKEAHTQGQNTWLSKHAFREEYSERRINCIRDLHVGCHPRSIPNVQGLGVIDFHLYTLPLCLDHRRL